MNQSQRDFLESKIKASSNKRIEELKVKIGNEPLLNNYLVSDILRGKVKFKDPELMQKEIIKMVKGMKPRDEFIEDEYRYRNDYRDYRNMIKLPALMIFEMPPEYKEEWDKWNKNKQEIEAQIAEIEMQLETLIMRVKLASPKTLEALVNDIDDMGELRLIDTKLKQLTA